MIIFKHKISKKFAIKASLYRRCARNMCVSEKFKFGIEQLQEMYDKESLGVGRSFEMMKNDNGYAYGKWIRDLFVSMMIEDIRSGDAPKIEYLSTTIDRIHNNQAIKNIIPGRFFPYEK